ncbi:MAG: glycosyl transferase, partial [Bryobacteraceae bacterium]|nr:glycosyl transferase [Bryobacteraceae bacterium]
MGKLAQRLLAILGNHSLKLAAAFVLIATVRIVSVYPVYNHTIDEPAHIACGMEWLSKGQYTLEPQHPPLARIFNAIGPYLDGARSTGRNVIYQEGAAILTAGGNYQERLTQARAGTLIFFWLACGALFWLASLEHGRPVGALAVLLFSATPGILGHAGLATTDMALAATFLLAAAAFIWWSKKPVLQRAALLGVSSGLLLTSKFSALFFLPLFLAAWLLLRRKAIRPLLTSGSFASIALALAAGALTVWGVYRFSFGPAPGGFSSPAPEIFAGIRQAQEHNAQGHPSYLLGDRNRIGFLAFYPVAFAVKTPLPLLLAALAGWWMLWKKRNEGAVAALAIAASMLLTGFASNINIGTRHLLPLYGAFALGGAVCLHTWLKPQVRREWA